MNSKILFLFVFFGCTSLLAQWNVVNSFSFHSQPGTLAAIGNDTVIVAADNSLIQSSYDGGQSFAKDSLPFHYSWFHDIHFPTGSTGYVCGGTAFGQVKSPIAKTTDGGQTWDSLSGNEFGYELYAVHFIDENIGFFAGQNIIVKTTDGGQSFTVDSLENAWYVRDIYFMDTSIGFYLSNEHIFKSTDGGQTWSIVYTEPAAGTVAAGMKLDFINPQVGFALTQAGNLVKTLDGGQTWNLGITSPDSAVIDFQFLNEDVGYAISSIYRSTGPESKIYRTTDGGQSWLTQYSDTGQSFVNIEMVSEDVGYVLGTSELLATTNGGISLKEAAKIEGAQVYPNPASQSFTLELPKNTNIKGVKLVDMTGRSISNLEHKKSSSTYHLSGIEEGSYFLRITTSEGILHHRLNVSR